MAWPSKVAVKHILTLFVSILDNLSVALIPHIFQNHIRKSRHLIVLFWGTFP